MFHLSFREWSILPTESGLGLKERYIPTHVIIGLGVRNQLLVH